ncbi:WD repeat-containing protein 66 [Paragonimus heterotremus]|uniref:Cilia- and flagella-associated protein 251 n=1 Tax=Paragonimus heterotremus TaxID=100268 RepID=A0A8J4WHZ8_9TREM|nr:WD repeat-containing protein 66 [Paragonimus heterotremus]
MLSPHKNGVICVALTEDARYLATLSADEINQKFAIWNWTTGSEIPLCEVILTGGHLSQNWINFKFGNYYHVVTNSQRQVIFYNWNINGEIYAYAPPLTDEDFDKKVGNFVGSCYVPESNVAITATTQGLLVVWETDKINIKKDAAESQYKKAVKLVPIHDKPITFMTITRSRLSKFCIVTGDVTGVIKFFDTNYMLLYWYQNLNAGPIASVSFASRGILDESSILLESTGYPELSTIPGEKFVVEDFIVTTAHANMISVNVDGSVLTYIHRDNHEDVTDLTCHPTLPHLTTCSLTGILKTFHYENKTVLAMRDFGTNDPIQSCRYCKTGLYIAVGFVSGYVRIVDSMTLKDVTSEPFTYGRGAITHVDFAPLNRFFAYADSAFTTTLVIANKRSEVDPWVYVGRIRAHYRKINDLRFWAARGSKTCRLFTIGDDRTLVEYDLYQASKNYFPMLARVRIDQMHIPLCLSELPPHYKEDFIFVSNDTSKFKLINATSFMCRKVVMAYPQAIQYYKVLPLPSDPLATAHFLLCMSEERLSLVMLPLDGDPLKNTNLIAHPSGKRGSGKASALAVSNDGRYVFTAGGPDTCVHMWGVNPKILEDRVLNACEVKRRFYDLLSPTFLNELKDYYYYSMLRTQGLKCLDTRQTSLTIPITEISYVMRAVGFYPTEEEILDMINEVKYSKFCETGSYVTDIGLDTFIQMYCNYRPHQGVLYKDVEKAFDRLCHVRDSDTGKSLYFRDPREKIKDTPKIPPEYLFNTLQTIGEPIGESELIEYLAVLMGNFPEGGNPEVTEPINSVAITRAVDESLPMFLSAENFVRRILGMQFCSTDKLEEDYLDKKLRVTDSISPSPLDHTESNENKQSCNVQTD